MKFPQTLSWILAGVLVVFSGTTVWNCAGATRTKPTSTRSTPAKEKKTNSKADKEASSEEQESLAHVAAPKQNPAEPVVIPRSVFAMPSSPKDGRDPFFPDSSRLAVSTEVQSSGGGSSSNAPTIAVQFSLRGLAGQADARFATIMPEGGNASSRTIDLEEGDTAQVVTPKGQTTVRCVQIKDESVIIEVAGVQKELRLRAGF